MVFSACDEPSGDETGEDGDGAGAGDCEGFAVHGYDSRNQIQLDLPGANLSQSCLISYTFGSSSTFPFRFGFSAGIPGAHEENHRVFTCEAFPDDGISEIVAGTYTFGNSSSPMTAVCIVYDDGEYSWLDDQETGSLVIETIADDGLVSGRVEFRPMDAGSGELFEIVRGTFHVYPEHIGDND